MGEYCQINTINVNVAVRMEEFSPQTDFFIKEDEFLGDVSGNMNIPSINRPANGDGVLEFNTLDEPIRQTIVRDLKAVGDKFVHVLYPRQQTNLLTECYSKKAIRLAIVAMMVDLNLLRCLLLFGLVLWLSQLTPNCLVALYHSFRVSASLDTACCLYLLL